MNINENNLTKQADDDELGSTTVDRFMTIETISLNESTTISTAIKTLKVNKISGAPVLNSKGELVGIISEYDLMIQAATSDHKSKIKFTKNIYSLKPDNTLKEALIQLLSKKVKRMPVISNKNHLLGIVSRLDILNALINKHFEDPTERSLKLK